MLICALKYLKKQWMLVFALNKIKQMEWKNQTK